MKHKLVLLLCSISLSVLHAQQPRSITLEEAIGLGLKNSKQLKSSTYKIEEATAALREALDQRLPSAAVSGSYLRLSSANIDVKSSGNSGSGSGSGSAPEVSQAMYGMMNLSMPLYAGGRIRYGIESYTYLQKAATLDAEKDKDEVIQNTIEAFASLFKSGTAVKLIKENLGQSQQRVKEMQELEKNGVITRNDLLKAELQSSNLELNLLDAENNHQLANLSMDLLLGLPAETILLADTTGVRKTEDDRQMNAYVTEAMQNRFDRTALSYRIKAAATNVKSVKAEMLPSFQLTGGYIAADIPKVLTVTNAINIGVGVSYNIGNLWKNKAKRNIAEARLNEIKVTGDQLDDQIRMQVSKAYYSLLTYRKKIEVMARADEQAKENYRIVKNKFDNKLATMSELLEADVARLQANMSYTLAQADAFVAYHKLLQASGLLAKEINQ